MESQGNDLSPDNGYIGLYRSFLDGPIFSHNGNVVKVAVYLLCSANHAPKWYRGVEIQRGQCIRSVQRIADDCHLSTKAVRHALAIFKKHNFASVKSVLGANQGQMITICEYDSYISSSSQQGQTEGEQRVQQRANKGTTNNNDKNEKNTPLTPQGGKSAMGKESSNPKTSPLPKSSPPPTVEDALKWARLKGHPEPLVRKAWEYYDRLGWKDSRGTPVKAWKQKFLAVWLSPEKIDEFKKSEPIPAQRRHNCPSY